MANLFKVGDSVICQKKGGQSGTKALSPEFPGKVMEVLEGGSKYRVNLKKVGMAHTPLIHFKGGIVSEGHMSNA